MTTLGFCAMSMALLRWPGVIEASPLGARIGLDHCFGHGFSCSRQRLFGTGICEGDQSCDDGYLIFDDVGDACLECEEDGGVAFPPVSSSSSSWCVSRAGTGAPFLVTFHHSWGGLRPARGGFLRCSGSLSDGDLDRMRSGSSESSSSCPPTPSCAKDHESLANSRISLRPRSLGGASP